MTQGQPLALLRKTFLARLLDQLLQIAHLLRKGRLIGRQHR